jgi:ABC-type sugar transport system ATPase subunit
MLEMRGISKSFGNVRALQDVEFRAESGKVHGLIGANGAGKSTLMKILSGIHRPDKGMISIGGKPVRFQSPSDAQELGIGIVPQEMELVMNMTVEENVLLTRLPTKFRVLLDFKGMRERARALLDSVHFGADPETPVRNLRYIDKVKTEIARVLSLSPRICIFDEVSSTLCLSEVSELYDVISNLKAEGSAIIYITHRLEELFRICDEITILKNGRLMGNYPVENLDMDKASELMIGRTQESVVRAGPVARQGDVVLSVRGLSSPKLFNNVSFDLHKGEIVVFVGVVGSGIEDLTRALFGLVPVEHGEIQLDGESVELENPQAAIDKGMMYLPKNRQDGLVFTMSVQENVTLSILERLRQLYWFIDRGKERKVVEDWVGNLNILASDIGANISSLSGGNQQKVILSRLLARRPDILILQDPTRGVDVGVKEELRGILNELSDEGVSIIIASSEIPEALKLHHRILIMHDGEIIKELQGEHITEADVEKCLVIGKQN